MWQYIIIFIALILSVVFLARYFIRKFKNNGCDNECYECPYNQHSCCLKYDSLQISKKQILNEIAVLMARQQLSEYSREVDYLEKKHGTSFNKFDKSFRNQTASYEMENDWMRWKFAVEIRKFWKDILNGNGHDL